MPPSASSRRTSSPARRGIRGQGTGYREREIVLYNLSPIPYNLVTRAAGARLLGVPPMTAKTGALKTPTGNQPKEWQCLTCEYVVVSPTLPYKCPRCGASRVKFVVKGETGEGE